jgi:hypothetical protein
MVVSHRVAIWTSTVAGRRALNRLLAMRVSWEILMVSILRSARLLQSLTMTQAHYLSGLVRQVKH